MKNPPTGRLTGDIVATLRDEQVHVGGVGLAALPGGERPRRQVDRAA
jgi:hypothetical protein